MRENLEYSVIMSLFGDWSDNPFEIEELKKIIDELDPELFSTKPKQLVVRAIKKLNKEEKFSASIPTIDMVLAYVELNAPKLLELFQATLIESGEYQPLCIELLKEAIELLKQYKIKEELQGI